MHSATLPAGKLFLTQRRQRVASWSLFPVHTCSTSANAVEPTDKTKAI